MLPYSISSYNIYIYIDRERERERESLAEKSSSFCASRLLEWRVDLTRPAGGRQLATSTQTGAASWAQDTSVLKHLWGFAMAPESLSRFHVGCRPLALYPQPTATKADHAEFYHHTSVASHKFQVSNEPNTVEPLDFHGQRPLELESVRPQGLSASKERLLRSLLSRNPDWLMRSLGSCAAWRTAVVASLMSSETSNQSYEGPLEACPECRQGPGRTN